MKFQTLALAAAMTFGGLAAGQAFAQDRDMTITRETPSGAVVTKHIRADNDGDGSVVHKTTRVVRPDGSTVVRRTTRVTHYGSTRIVTPHRTVVLRRHYDPLTGQTVATRTVHRDAD